MTDQNDASPNRIIVDDDWKEEARRQKEQADRETREYAQPDQIPPASFAEIIQMIVLQASVALGGVRDPQTGQPIPPSLPLAKHYIDLLGVLEIKTRNNLDAEENAILQQVLHELRLAFVQIAGASGRSPRDAAGAQAERTITD